MRHGDETTRPDPRPERHVRMVWEYGTDKHGYDAFIITLYCPEHQPGHVHDDGTKCCGAEIVVPYCSRMGARCIELFSHFTRRLAKRRERQEEREAALRLLHDMGLELPARRPKAEA